MSLDTMKKRLAFDGGPTCDGRFTDNKLKSFRSALWNSYQAEWITLDKKVNHKKQRCLINPEKLTNDYEQKIISIDYISGVKPGDTFYWDRTEKHWIVYDQYHEEKAYFRAKIRECDYSIECNGNTYWCYVRGPVETALVWRQKHKIEMNDLNYSLELYVTKNEDTLEYFTRHQIIKFDGHNWKVAATDKYSQDGIIEVYLAEYFDNDMEDAMIEPEVEKPNTKVAHIEGPQIVKPFDTNLKYSISGNATASTFSVDSNKVKITSQNSSTCTLEIVTGKSGSFTLSYGSLELDVLIKSL